MLLASNCFFAAFARMIPRQYRLVHCARWRIGPRYIRLPVIYWRKSLHRFVCAFPALRSVAMDSSDSRWRTMDLHGTRIVGYPRAPSPLQGRAGYIAHFIVRRAWVYRFRVPQEIPAMPRSVSCYLTRPSTYKISRDYESRYLGVDHCVPN